MLNKKDLQIIASLRKNSRQRLTKISKNLKIPVSTIFARIKQNEKTLLLQNTTLLDFSYLGFNTRAHIFFKAKEAKKKEFIDYLHLNENVNSLYKVNNGFDCMAEVVFKNLKHLEDFLEKIDIKFGIKKKEVHYILDDLKREKFFSDPETIDLIV